MFSYEYDMLEVMLHELYPVVDEVYIAESETSHSLQRKAAALQQLFNRDERFADFRAKTKIFRFTPIGEARRRRWAMENQQRQFVAAKMAQRASVGDILIANMDLDEIISRESVLIWKYCDVGDKAFAFTQFQFRYHLNCLWLDRYSVYLNTVFDYIRPRQLLGHLTVSRRRTRASAVAFLASNVSAEMLQKKREGTLSWHLSSFGTPELILRKIKNSPHKLSMPTTVDTVRADMANCSGSGTGTYGFRLDRLLPPNQTHSPAVLELLSHRGVHAFPLPMFIERNHCWFRSKGWFGPAPEPKSA
jgi:hypothetical protein